MPRYQHGALMTPQGMMPLATVAQPMMMATRPMVSVAGHNAGGTPLFQFTAVYYYFFNKITFDLNAEFLCFQLLQWWIKQMQMQPCFEHSSSIQQLWRRRLLQWQWHSASSLGRTMGITWPCCMEVTCSDLLPWVYHQVSAIYTFYNTGFGIQICSVETSLLVWFYKRWITFEYL